MCGVSEPGLLVTRMVSARPLVDALKPFALKFFFSNQYTYAHIQRRADGVVRSARNQAGNLRLPSRPPLTPLQIIAAASTIEKTLRETLPSRTDVAAARKIGARRRT